MTEDLGGTATLLLVLLAQAQRRHKNSHRNSGGELTEAVEELRDAFERAERACPGICDVFLCEMLHRLAPGLSLHRIQDALQRLRWVPGGGRKGLAG